MTSSFAVSRRAMLTQLTIGVGGAALMSKASAKGRYEPLRRPQIHARDLGIKPGDDARSALQSALDRLVEKGGGTLTIGDRWRCEHLVIRGSQIEINGAGGTLIDCRITITQEAADIVIRDLTLLETSGDAASYLLDVSGTGCYFSGLKLEKRPFAGGYQGYLRSKSGRCRFEDLSLRGSNGLFVAGHDHVFDGFHFISTMRRDFGGDDAFAIKGAGSLTRNIDIRNGTVRGFAAAISIGSEIGSNTEFPGQGAVRNVTVSNVTADRCQMLAFIKPGALIYDWRNGLVENVRLTDMRLVDPDGFLFARGLVINAARGAVVRNISARNILIVARARTQGVMQTAAVDIVIRSQLPAATIKNVEIAVDFAGGGEAGFPVDHIVRVEKAAPDIGWMSNIKLDVTGSHARISGIHIGAGLDNAVSIHKARLTAIGLDPPSSLGAAGIWADSKFHQNDVSIITTNAPSRGGSAL